MANERLKADFCILLLALVWGSSFAVVKRSLESVDPLPFLAFRFTIAAILSMPYLLSRKRSGSRADFPRGGASLISAGGLAAAFLFAGFAFQTVGLSLTTASRSGFITGLSVVLVPVILFAFYRHRPGKRTILAVVVSTIGLALLTQPGGGWNRGDLWTLGCALGFAAHIVALEAFAHRFHPFDLYFVQVVGVALASWTVVLILGRPLGGFSAWAWFGVTYMGIAATAVAFFLQTWAQARTTATRTAIVLAMEPVFAAGLARLLLNELLSEVAMAGGLLIVAAIFLSVRKTDGGSEALTDPRRRPGGKRPHHPERSA